VSWAAPLPPRRGRGSLGGQSALASVTAILYLVGGLLLLVATVFYTPGKNPRWALGALGGLGVVMATVALLRGRAFTRLEATVMLAIQLLAIAAMTHTSHLDAAAFSNGIGLPLVGIYTSLLLSRRAVIVYYLGLAAFVGAVAERGDSTLTTAALVMALEATIATEIVRVLFERMRWLARADPLTGVLNRHGLEAVGQRLLTRARRRRTPVSVVLIDLDDLRAVNNSRGHRAGDDLLVAATRQWLDELSGDEAVGRVGGDEFVLMLPGVGEDRARERVEALAAAATVNWTAGVAQLRGEESLADLIERADQAMYARKPVRSADLHQPEERSDR
jgi:diguanylate cyclase (GGDEF)-like protein